jgi:hypothetical protein
MGVEEEELQNEGIDNLLNGIILENFPNLKKESPRYGKLTEHQTIRIKRETPPDTQHTEQRRNSESCKR